MNGSSEHVAGCFERSKRQQEEKTRENSVDENAFREYTVAGWMRRMTRRQRKRKGVDTQ